MFPFCYDMFPRTGTKPDINQKVSCHVETVVLLGRKNVDGYINIDLDVSSLQCNAGASATYAEIHSYVKEQTGLHVSYLYIAQIKGKYGIKERENYNKGSNLARVPTCPPEKEAAIVHAFKHFGMIAQ